jgi:hypothetical protein
MMNIKIFNSREFGITEHEKHQLRTVGAIAMFLMWIKMGYWMKLFEGPAMFIT